MKFFRESDFNVTLQGKTPKEWRTKKVSDVCKVATGGTPSTKHPEFFGDDIKWLKSGDIKQLYTYDTTEKLTQLGIENSNAKMYPAGSVAIALSGRGQTRGRTTITKAPMSCSQSVAFMIPGSEVLAEYLHYNLSNRYIELRNLTGNLDRSGLNLSIVGDIQIPLPSLLEQRAIAGILVDVDSALELADRGIAKTERLKKGLMQHLLTHGVGHTEYKETPIGRIPKTWQVTALKNVVEIDKKSRDPSREMPDESFLYIDIESVEGGTGKIRNPKKVLGKEAPSRARRVVHENDVIMSTVRPYLKAFAIVPKEYDNQICSTGFAVLSCGSSVLPNFLLNVLFSSRVVNQCNKMMVGGQYPALNQSQVSQIQIPFPSLLEQRKISEIFLAVDKKLGLERDEKTKLERLKQGLMDLLLTGKVRIKVD